MREKIHGGVIQASTAFRVHTNISGDSQSAIVDDRSFLFLVPAGYSEPPRRRAGAFIIQCLRKFPLACEKPPIVITGRFWFLFRRHEGKRDMLG